MSFHHSIIMELWNDRMMVFEKIIMCYLGREKFPNSDLPGSHIIEKSINRFVVNEN